MDARKEEVEVEVKVAEAKAAALKEQMADLKTKLYAKFGNAINLEAEEESQKIKRPGLATPFHVHILLATFIGNGYCCSISCSMKSFCSASIFWRASHSTLRRSRAIFRSTMSACSCCCSCSRALVTDCGRSEHMLKSVFQFDPSVPTDFA